MRTIWWLRKNKRTTKRHLVKSGTHTVCGRRIPEFVYGSEHLTDDLCMLCTERGSMQQDIYELVRYNLATTNASMLAWLSIKYVVNKQSLNNMLKALIAKRKIYRLARGIYRPCSV